MKLSMKWLSDYTDVNDISIKDYCDKMTMSGSKVEGYDELGTDVTGVKCGKILSISRHPNAEKLVICQVDVGKDAPVQIITAATNVFEGALVPVALDGAHLCGDINIKTSKLRGETSEGMFCSISELGLTLHDMPGDVEDGILILNDVNLGDTKPGDDISEVLGLKDTVVEFEITSNRPDCLSVIGLARETGVTFNRKFNYEKPSFRCSDSNDTIDNYLSVKISNPDKCYRYSARVVKNVKIKPSPLWLRMRLRASGVRPINNIVDITNYVMLEFGQPMHAFDYKCLSGSSIDVRNAYDNETFVSLDSIPHTLNSSMLVISDNTKAVALAGVMGGENSEITDNTQTVVFESATFHPGSVRKAAQKLGMRTESSSRFEKGLDVENTMPALDRACELIELLDAGEVVNGTIDIYPNKKKLFTLPLDSEKINKFLGIDLTREEMANILKSLEFEVSDDLRQITVPSFRDDVRCMNDVAEEVLRIYGYDKIKSTLSSTAKPTVGVRTERQYFDESLVNTLIGIGINQIETFSFISPSWYDKIRLDKDDNRRKCITIKNPLGEDTSVMRTTTIPSMMKILSDNCNMKNFDAQLFELGRIYLPTKENELPEEPSRLSIGFTCKDGFYKMKGFVEAVLQSAGIENPEFISCDSEPSFHPGRCAEVHVSGKKIALFGEIHPQVIENYGLSLPAYVAEIDVDNLFEFRRKEIIYTPIPRHPAVERDFSFVCDENIEAGKIASVIKNCSKLIEKVELFDIYRGHQIGEGKKSMSYAVTLRSSDRTLNDNDANETVKNILDVLSTKLGIKLR